jgi:hypothetical protein
MRGMTMRHFAVAIALSLLASAAARSQSVAQNMPGAAPDHGAREKPAARVQDLADAPLSLSVKTKWATPDHEMLEVYFTVTNVGSRPVRAYAVRVTRGAETHEGGGCYVNNIDRAGKILQPNQSAGRSTWRPVAASDAETPVELTLDFVEFADGTVWGADSCQAAERLGGMRAGARAAKLLFKRKLDEKGIDTLVKRLYADDPALAPPEGHSDPWTAGFRGAVNSYRERIRQANVEGGLPEVQAALQRPFDAADNQ